MPVTTVNADTIRGIKMDISIRIGGAAGQGIQTISAIIAKTFVRHGYYVFINQDFESRIRGGHNFDQVRISNTPVQAPADRVHILIALNEETTRKDIDCLAEDGVLLFDGESIDFASDEPYHLSVPFARIASETGKSKIMINAVATGAAAALLNFKLQPVLDGMHEQFQSRGAETVAKNQNCATAGYEFVRENRPKESGFRVPSITRTSMITPR